MNIVLIGSCFDSSCLSKELNKKMKNSVVFRIDLLKNLKNIIPFSSMCNTACGDYLGDIEKIDFNRITEAERTIAKSFNIGVKLIEENSLLANAMSSKRTTLPSIDRVTRNFDCLSLTLIRVVSGIQSVNQLTRYLNSNSSAVVVYLNKPNLPLFDIDMTKEQFLSFKDDRKYAGHLFLTAEDLNALLKDEVFELLVNPAVKTKGELLKPIADEAKEVAKTTVGYERALIQHAGPGILHQLQAVPGNAGAQRLTMTMLDDFINQTMTEPAPTVVEAEEVIAMAA